MTKKQTAEQGIILSLVSVSSLTSQTSDVLIYEAATLLHQQWPRGGSVAYYSNKLADSLKESPENSPLLPMSYLLLMEKKDMRDDRTEDSYPRDEDMASASSAANVTTSTVLGHGRLTECCEIEGSAGKAVAATFIVIHPSYRGKGFGSKLMHALEQTARSASYHYLYLWTTTRTAPFYERLDYHRTTRVSLHSACLKGLGNSQVDKLEAMLAARTNSRARETVLLPPATSDAATTDADDLPNGEDDGTRNDVWLRKRLIECLPEFKVFGHDERITEIRRFVVQQQQSSGEGRCYRQWRYQLCTKVPWQQQVGPSCGLTCLRMLAKLFSSSLDNNDNCTTPSLLSEAQARGYTRDGEMFNVHHLCAMAELCGLAASVCALHSSDNDLRQQLSHRLRGQPSAFTILSYDSQHSTHLPCKVGGLQAHYGICVGMLFARDGCPEGDPFTLEPLPEDDDDDDISSFPVVYLLIQQSLSSRLVIAPLDDFVASNLQLAQIHTEKYPAAATMNLSGCCLVCSNQSIEVE